MYRNKRNNNSNTFLSQAYSNSKYDNTCPLTEYSEHEINYKNRDLLCKFTSECGRILPRRITSVCAKKQRMLASAIKKARCLSLLPYCDK